MLVILNPNIVHHTDKPVKVGDLVKYAPFVYPPTGAQRHARKRVVAIIDSTTHSTR